MVEQFEAQGPRNVTQAEPTAINGLALLPARQAVQADVDAPPGFPGTERHESPKWNGVG